VQYIPRILTERLGDLSRLDLLDVGCGIGNIHPFFAGKVRSVRGVDVSSVALRPHVSAVLGSTTDTMTVIGCLLMMQGSMWPLRSVSCTMCRRRNGRHLPASCGGS
jgi:hypothetical protein